MKKLLFFCLLMVEIAHANMPRSAIAAGVGGAGVASVEAGEASFMNPANITHLKERNFYTSFQKNLFALSIIENDKGSVVPGAVSYFADKDTEMFALSLADFVYENISLGISANYWQVELDTGKKRQITINANAGITWTPIENLGIGFSAENVLSPPQKFQDNLQLEPSSRIGFNYLYRDWFRWRLDFVTFQHNRWDKWTPQTGIESYLSKWFIIRTGVSHPTGLKESWSVGIGFDLPRFRLDYASQWHVDGGNEHRHYVDLVIPF